jgi:circadian clock protein KaiB
LAWTFEPAFDLDQPLTKKTNRKARALLRALANRPEGKHFLRLYVAGATARSREVIKRVYQLCEAAQKGNYDLEVIDVYQHPNLARADQIVATPTLVKLRPLPVRRFIGNMSNPAGLFGDPAQADEELRAM